jgi:hypothetical protein
MENRYQDEENEIAHMEHNADICDNEGLLRIDVEAEEQDGEFRQRYDADVDGLINIVNLVESRAEQSQATNVSHKELLWYF